MCLYRILRTLQDCRQTDRERATGSHSVVVSESVARRWLDRRDWQLAVCVVVVGGGDFFFFLLLLLLVVVDNDSFRIAVHITLMGRAGFFIFVFLWVCRSVAGVLGFWWRGGREREPRWSAAAVPRTGGRAEVGADHVEVKWSSSAATGQGRSLSSTLGEVTRAGAGRAEKNAPLAAAIAATSVCVGRHSGAAATAASPPSSSALPQPSRPSKITHEGRRRAERAEREGQAERVGVVVVGMAMVASFCECPNSLVHSRGKSSATLE